MITALTRLSIAAALVVTLAGCTPLLVGAGAAVVADEAMEREEGGDGLFLAVFRCTVFAAVFAIPLHAGDGAVQVVNGIRLIDAKHLSVAELQARAAEERANAGAHSCCDWGGGGCRVETVRWMQDRRSQPPAASTIPLIAGDEAPE